jgi:phosphoglycolate phosphatase-like HAD superfamily hydrolase
LEHFTPFEFISIMNTQLPDIIAFDFDGVICDGLIEYFQAAWAAYCQLYHLGEIDPPDGLAERFYKLRPVIETGWEMPIMLKVILSGVADETILAQWPVMAIPILEKDNLDVSLVAKAVDSMRDHWIHCDLDRWLGLHRFYPGLLDRLQTCLGTLPTYIISTKEGRFIYQLLQQNGVKFPETAIFGKEVKQPKYETLRQLIAHHTQPASNPITAWFIEDRIKALQGVANQPDLTQVELFLADWGYNLAAERSHAQGDQRIHLISLDRIVQKFDCWV